MTLTRVECVKKRGPRLRPLLLTHVGANQFPWETYRPDAWPHRWTLLDGKYGGTVGEDCHGSHEYDIAGPMCFQVNNYMLWEKVTYLKQF